MFLRKCFGIIVERVLNVANNKDSRGVSTPQSVSNLLDCNMERWFVPLFERPLARGVLFFQ